jgi:hypothetical protein
MKSDKKFSPEFENTYERKYDYSGKLVMRNRNYFLWFQFRLLTNYDSGSSYDLWQATVPVPVPVLTLKYSSGSGSGSGSGSVSRPSKAQF